MSRAALSTLARPMWLPDPRWSSAPHFEGQRSLSGGGCQVCAFDSTATIKKRNRGRCEYWLHEPPPGSVDGATAMRVSPNATFLRTTGVLRSLPSCSKERSANPGIAITPLMLGGNVFGWTADEARRLRCWTRSSTRAATPSTRRMCIRPGCRDTRAARASASSALAEAERQARQGGDRHQGRHVAEAGRHQARQHHRRLRGFAAAARRRDDRSLLAAPRRRGDASGGVSRRARRW